MVSLEDLEDDILYLILEQVSSFQVSATGHSLYQAEH
jgi:hypothetical protein